MGHLGIQREWSYEMPTLSRADNGAMVGTDTTVSVTVTESGGVLVLRVKVALWVADAIKALHTDCTDEGCHWTENGQFGLWWSLSRRPMAVALPVLWRRCSKQVAEALDKVIRDDVASEMTINDTTK
jgi:hypothetical protein